MFDVNGPELVILSVLGLIPLLIGYWVIRPRAAPRSHRRAPAGARAPHVAGPSPVRARIAAVIATELAVMVFAAFAALLLATYDVHVRADGRDISCGSAYAVALLERDCSMGGEMARDQGAVDRTGVARAWTYLGLAGLAGLGAARSGAYAAILLTRQVRHRDGRVADPERFVRA